MILWLINNHKVKLDYTYMNTEFSEEITVSSPYMQNEFWHFTLNK